MADGHFVARHRAIAGWEPAVGRVLDRLGAEWELAGGTYVGRRRAPSPVQIRYATVVTTTVLGAGVIVLAASTLLHDHATSTPYAHADPVIAQVVQEGQAGGDDGTVAVRGEPIQATRQDDRGSPLKTQPAEDIWTAPIADGEYDLTSFYGSRWGVLHAGIDLAAPTGTTVLAAHRGTVAEAGWAGSYGYLVVIDHGEGLKTYYAHNSALTVDAGDEVQAGDPIAKVGNTGYSLGPHSHFEVHVDGEKIDPLPFLREHGLDVEKGANQVYANSGGLLT